MSDICICGSVMCGVCVICYRCSRQGAFWQTQTNCLLHPTKMNMPPLPVNPTKPKTTELATGCNPRATGCNPGALPPPPPSPPGPPPEQFVWRTDVWRTGKAPAAWKDVGMLAFYKCKGHRLDLNSYRGIASSPPST